MHRILEADREVVIRTVGSAVLVWRRSSGGFSVHHDIRVRVALAGLVGLLVQTGAQATDFHVCDCGPAADANCVVGNDAATGQMGQPWRTYDKARLAFSSLAAGDAVRFCAGGHWQVDAQSPSRWTNAQCTAALPCKVGMYQADWSDGDEGRPLLQRTNADAMFDLADGGSANHEEGYQFEDLVLQGVGGFGVFAYNDVDDVSLLRLDIAGFQIAVHVAGSNACDAADPLCDGRNERIILQDSAIHDNHQHGWLGGSSGSQIVRNTFARNGSVASFDHNIYASGHTQGMRIRGNSLLQSTLDGAGSCSATSLVVHGSHVDLRIEDNEVRELPGLANAGCWGISVVPGYTGSWGVEGFQGLILRGNRIFDVGNVAISVGACQQCVVEDNLVVQTQQMATRGIAVSPLTPTPEDLVDVDVIVRNNSLYFASNQAHSGVDVRAGSGQGAVVVSNAVRFEGGDSGFNCFDLGVPWSGYVAIDHNLCDTTRASLAEWNDGAGALAAWQSLSAWDLHSAMVDPGFADPASGVLEGFRLLENSAARDAGDPLLSSSADAMGNPRDVLPDVGAFEYIVGGAAGVFADGFE